MRVGMLGSGSMGGKLGTIFARAGHKVVFSYARSNDELKKLARYAQGNARAGTPVEAAKEADALLLAVHWSRIDEVLKQVGDLSRKVIVTCCLPMDSANSELVIGTTTSGGQELARKVPSAKVVCAFNTVPSEVLFGVFEARSKKPRPNLTRVLMRSMLDPYGSPGTPSRLRCSSAKSPTTGKVARKSRTASSDLGNRGAEHEKTAFARRGVLVLSV